ncbi:MAG: phosphoenolpyruvate--protein phosphotransferase [Salinibacter sp.]
MSDASSQSGSDAARDAPMDRVLSGIGVAPGIAIGTVYCHEAAPPPVARTQIDPGEVKTELSLLDAALERARQELAAVRSVAEDRLDEEGEAILAAQGMMLRDEEVLGPVRRRIRERHESAAYALTTVLEAHRQRLEDSEDEYLRERAGDLQELETRLLRALDRRRTAARIDPSSIVVADQLSATDVIRFGEHGMLGFATAHGGETSHVSIVARALNLPAVVGVDDVPAAAPSRATAIIDGHRGRLVVAPSADTVKWYRTRRARHEALRHQHGSTDGPPPTTADGHSITLQATVDFGTTLDDFDSTGADGIGLMRTEVLFLQGEPEPLSETRQAALYRRAAERAGPAGATIRLLDLGGDKGIPYATTEENPFLGWRGIRVLLDRPDELLRPQLRALLRANRHGSLRVLLPMVTHLDEVHHVRTLLAEEAQRLSDAGAAHDAALPVGTMVEVPSVALQADRFARAVDFLSIGTNDLTQYVLAVDRGNDWVAERYDALHPAVLALLRRTIDAGRAADTPVALCGEVAADVSAVPLLLGLGLDTLSVPPSYLPLVRHVVAETPLAAAEALADDLLRAPDAGTVRRRLREWCDQHLDADLFSAVEDA